ncbi:hypothetical protein CH278_13135 [Rhodococcus sp. 05-2254-5]|uniref:hypothetical protein n=1 Tax=unclassified Rhodococcus (in: high G+C Gram-positive bacteria) TaxID=192944 RepID=UPI000B9BD1E2|nr:MULTISPECIES: hypothetical protein [unclassified Rhodococcus (in: high G+C Gram-positive bacteria)]OZE33557.1 hypothetical protein CH278_13135 [Rhodococcus sp. 05-2254-5]OZE51076.1 hypothetical protein CH269_26080 [Rhodococcus sp. 05-2254-1]
MFLKEQAASALAAAERVDLDRITEEALDDLEAAIWEQAGVEPLEVSWDDKWSAGAAEKSMPIHRSDGPSVDRKVRSLEVYVPYTGTKELWSKVIDGAQDLVRSGENLLGRAKVHSDEELMIEMFVGGMELRDVTNELSWTTNKVKTYVGWCNERVETWSTTVRADVRARLQERRLEAQRGAALDDALGIPVRKRPTEEQIPIPLTRKSLKLPPAGMARRGQPDHVLEEEIYEDVVRTIDRLAVAMERTSTAFGLSEPEIRDLILIVLNANYDGQAVGEAFNAAGKTDILLRWQNRHAFIGECKFWTGQKSVTDAVDQLLSYTTWRDTKAALVVFIKDRKDIGAVIKLAKETMESHPDCKGFDSTRTEWDSCTRYILRKPDDADRTVAVALILVPLYAGK